MTGPLLEAQFTALTAWLGMYGQAGSTGVFGLVEDLSDAARLAAAQPSAQHLDSVHRLAARVVSAADAALNVPPSGVEVHDRAYSEAIKAYRRMAELATRFTLSDDFAAERAQMTEAVTRGGNLIGVAHSYLRMLVAVNGLDDE